MPDAAQWFITVAAVVTAIGLLVKKVVIPGYRGVGVIEDALPVFRAFTATFKDNTDVFRVINDIAAQFRTDSGSSLRDAIDELCQMAETNKINIETARRLAQQVATESQATGARLEARFEASRQLDEQKAQQAERLMLQNDRTLVLVTQMMTDRAQVATDLTAREKKVDAASGSVATDLTERQRQIDEASSGVASDLAASRRRADDIVDEVPGTAADAASQTPQEPDR